LQRALQRQKQELQECGDQLERYQVTLLALQEDMRADHCVPNQSANARIGPTGSSLAGFSKHGREALLS